VDEELVDCLAGWLAGKPDTNQATNGIPAHRKVTGGDGNGNGDGNG